MLIIIFLLLLIVATVFAAKHNATMDIVKDHLSTSIFKGLEPQWYDPSVSWTNKTTPTIAKSLQLKYLPKFLHWIVNLKPGWDPLSDFWHWNKTQLGFWFTVIIILCILLGFQLHGWGILWITWLALLLFITTWLVAFNYFYNHKLVVKS